MTNQKPEPTEIREVSPLDAPPLNLRADFSTPSLDEWRRVVEQDLKGADFDKKLVWQTHEGLAVQPLYARPDLQNVEHLGGLPGTAPFTRGADPLQNVAEPWLVRQDCVLAEPSEANASIRRGLNRGMTAIGLRPDDAARAGLDPEEDSAADLVAKGGICLHTLTDLRATLNEVDLQSLPVAIRAGVSAPAMLAMLIALADSNGVDRKTLSGTVECDPLGDLARMGKSTVPLPSRLKEARAMATFAARECPRIRTIVADGSLWHHAGASAAQELCYTMATGAEYLRALTEGGLEANTAAKSIAFNFSVSTNLFMEIAKLRAARTIWAKITRAFGADEADAQKMALHVRTSCHTKTLYDPYTNMLRTTIEAFAGAVGGCQSMFVAPFDEVLGPPDEFSTRVARNQQIILREEAYLNKVVDPAAGSYYVESLTHSIAKAAWEGFRNIEKIGGMAAAIKAGSPQSATRETATKRRKAVTSRRDSIVGTSNYPNPTESLPIKEPVNSPILIAKRKALLEEYRTRRDKEKLQARLSELADCARDGESEPLSLAVEAFALNATLAEVLKAYHKWAHGEPEVVERLDIQRASESFEKLRQWADEEAASTGARPGVFLVPMGPLAMRKARAAFCFGFFGAGGFDVEEPQAFDSTEDAVKGVLDSGALVAVICSDDPSYPEIVPPIAAKVKAANKDVQIYVAGYPKDSIEALESAGVDGFVHLRADVVETLSALQNRLRFA